MRSPVPTLTDDQLDEIVQVDDIVRSLALYLPHIKCDPAAKNTVQLLLNRIELIRNHDRYSALLDNARRREIAHLKGLVTDLLNIIETGLMNHVATARARKLVRENLQ